MGVVQVDSKHDDVRGEEEVRVIDIALRCWGGKT